MIHAGTYGTLSFSDTDELVLQRKEDFDRIKADFEIFGIGDARMINRSENVKLNGTRMGPYNFLSSRKALPILTAMSSGLRRERRSSTALGIRSRWQKPRIFTNGLQG